MYVWRIEHCSMSSWENMGSILHYSRIPTDRSLKWDFWIFSQEDLYFGRIFFLGHILFLGRDKQFQTLLTLSSNNSWLLTAHFCPWQYYPLYFAPAGSWTGFDFQRILGNRLTFIIVFQAHFQSHHQKCPPYQNSVKNTFDFRSVLSTHRSIPSAPPVSNPLLYHLNAANAMLLLSAPPLIAAKN